MTLDLHEMPRSPLTLKLLDILHMRTNLSPVEQKNYYNLTKGYSGEMEFYRLLKRNLTTKHILLNNLKLKSNNSEFEIDSLLISQNTIYHFEVKNYEGDFYIERNNWYVSPSGKEINNPILQLKRSESLLRQLIQQLDYNFELESYVVFINPGFALFQTPLSFPIILLAQLNRFIQKLNHQPSLIGRNHQIVSEQFTEKHIEQSSNERLPKYNYDQLSKGMTCKSCSRFLTYMSPSKLYCNYCSSRDSTEQALIRSINDFNLLFPHKKVTTSQLYDWCAIIPSKKIIRRILTENFVRVGKGRGTHYIFKPS